MADSEVGARAYPIEAEEALNGWMSRREASGVWTSSAGWWYAAWMHRQAEVEHLQAELAEVQVERDEFRRMSSRFSQKDEEAMDIIHRAADLLRGDVGYLEQLAQANVELDQYRAVVEAARADNASLGNQFFLHVREALARLDASAQGARQQAAEPEPACQDEPGHMGWLVCPTHNQEITRRLGRAVRAGVVSPND